MRSPFLIPILLGANTALAQPVTELEMSLGGGAFVPAKDHELYDSTVTPQQPLKTFGLNLNLGLSFFLFQYVGAGVEGGFMPVRTETGQGGFVYAFRAHGIVQLPWIVTPYALVGGGALGIGSSKKSLGNDFDRALHWGVGVKTKVADRISIRLEGRHILSAAEGPQEGNTHHFEALIGVGISLWSWEPEEELPMLVEAPPPPKEVVYDAPPVEVVPVAQELVVEEDCTKAANNPNCKPEQVIVAEIQRAHFAWGSSVLRAPDFEALDNAVELLVEHPHLRLEIEGHTDSTGPHRHNMRLSKKRADAVLRYLVSRGIEPDRLSTTAFGPTNPVDSNRTMRGRASNRRSEIRVVNVE